MCLFVCYTHLECDILCVLWIGTTCSVSNHLYQETICFDQGVWSVWSQILPGPAFAKAEDIYVESVSGGTDVLRGSCLAMRWWTFSSKVDYLLLLWYFLAFPSILVSIPLVFVSQIGQHFDPIRRFGPSLLQIEGRKWATEKLGKQPEHKIGDENFLTFLLLL